MPLMRQHKRLTDGLHGCMCLDLLAPGTPPGRPVANQLLGFCQRHAIDGADLSVILRTTAFIGLRIPRFLLWISVINGVPVPVRA